MVVIKWLLLSNGLSLIPNTAFGCFRNTVPDVEKIEKRAGKISKEFSELVFPDGYQPGASKKKVRK